jgi:predicted secreted Zn-dependent protease
VASSPALTEAQAKPCRVAVSWLASFTQQTADRLASLRPLIVAKKFESSATISGTRQVSAVLATFLGLDRILKSCDATRELANRVERLRTAAAAPLAKAQSGKVTTAQVRQAALTLFGLVPEVLAISEAGNSVAASLGIAGQVAQVPKAESKPIGSLAPLPTPKPAPKPAPKPTPASSTSSIKPSFFGPGVKVSTFKVMGSSPAAIRNSIFVHGPHSEWLEGNAAALTQLFVVSNYSFANGTDGCQIVIEDSPAIRLSFKITLPRWISSSGASASTKRWWNGLLHDMAIHEKVHVDIYRATAKLLNAALASSTCATAERNLTAIWNDAERQNCEFDLREYGAAAGLTLKACLAN